MFYRFKEREVSRFLGQPNDLLEWPTQNQSTLSAQGPYLANGEEQLNRYLTDQALRNVLALCPSVNGHEQISWRSGYKELYNPCHHIRSRLVNLPYRALFERYRYPTTIYVNRYFRFDTPNLYPYFLRDIQHPDVDYQAARARAWHNMQPRFEGKISLINFLYELKDFRDIAKYVLKNGQAIKDLRKLLDALAGYRHKNLHPTDPTRGIATAILVNNFAIQPLIKDITTMFNQMNIIVREAQQQFQESGSDFQKSHYSEEIHRVDSRSAQTANNNYWYSSGFLRTTKFTATLRYKYDYSMRDTIDAWMKYWGLCGSFEAFWNMIPFSFLVDYFVRIGNSIHAMEHDPRVTLTEYHYGESLKTLFWNGITTRRDPRLKVLVVDGKVFLQADGNIPETLLSGIEGSMYSRVPRTPYYGPATPRLKLPSTTQTLNICALLRCLL